MDANTTPATPENKEQVDFKEKMGSAASASDKETPKDNGEKTPVEQKQTVESTQEDPAKTEEKSNEQQHDWKKRYDGESATAKRLSEERQVLIDTNVKLAQRRPEILKDLAETNPNLADQVAQKAFGYNSYEEYQKDKDIEELKETDPNQYETQKRINRLEANEKKRSEDAKSTFYKAKGIMVNNYDDDYKKVEKQLSVLDKNFVEEDPNRAYEIAYTLAFPEGRKAPEATPAEKHLADQTVKAGGNSSTQMPGSVGRFKNSDSKNFNDKFNSLAK